MPTSARMSLGFFGQFADVGIRAPAQNGLLQQALAREFPYHKVRESPRWIHAGFYALVIIAQKCRKLRDVAAKE